MIDAKDLRIGNWVTDRGILTPENRKPVQVNSIEIYPHEKVNGLIIKDFFLLIPLTPELLLKSHFKRTNEKEWDQFDNGKLSIYLNSSRYPNGRTYFNSWCIIEGVPKSVHQLQNLYYSLTGEELKIDL